MKLSLFLIVSLFFLSACGTSKTKLTNDGKVVRLLTTRPKTGCYVLDKVVGKNEKGSEELATNHARNLAGELEADSIYVDDVVQNGSVYKIFATAYNCQE